MKSVLFFNSMVPPLSVSLRVMQVLEIKRVWEPLLKPLLALTFTNRDPHYPLHPSVPWGGSNEWTLSRLSGLLMFTKGTRWTLNGYLMRDMGSLKLIRFEKRFNFTVLTFTNRDPHYPLHPSWREESISTGTVESSRLILAHSVCST